MVSGLTKIIEKALGKSMKKAFNNFVKSSLNSQGRSYDMMFAHTTIVFTRYLMLVY